MQSPDWRLVCFRGEGLDITTSNLLALLVKVQPRLIDEEKMKFVLSNSISIGYELTSRHSGYREQRKE